MQVQTQNELGELASTFNYMSQQLLAYDKENRGLYESLEQGYLETIVALANSIDSQGRVHPRPQPAGRATWPWRSAASSGCPSGSSSSCSYGGILHDIGKIGIVESILCKQSQLTAEEMAVMREHPSIGASIIGPVTFLGTVRAAVRSHHEKLGRHRLPGGAEGASEIPLIARIVAVRRHLRRLHLHPALPAGDGRARGDGGHEAAARRVAGPRRGGRARPGTGEEGRVRRGASAGGGAACIVSALAPWTPE